MIKHIIFFLVIIFAQSIFAGDKCTSYKNGKYKLVEPSLGIDQIIERRDNLQIETNLKTGEENRFLITWLDDCVYELTILQGTEEVMNFYKDKNLVVRIIELYSDGYKFEGHIKGSSEVSSYVMKRVH